jgi:hypothetical protein
MSANDPNSVEEKLRMLKEMREAGETRQVFLTVTREDAAALARGLVQLHEQMQPGERPSKFEPKLPTSSDIVENEKNGVAAGKLRESQSQLDKNKEAGQHQENFIEKSLDRAGVNHQPQQLMGTDKIAGGQGARIDEVIQTDDGVNVAPFESKCKTGSSHQVSERDLRQAEIIREVTNENMPLNAVVYVTTDGTAKTIPQMERNVFNNAVKLEVGESQESLREKQAMSDGPQEKLQPGHNLSEKAASASTELSGKEKVQPATTSPESSTPTETPATQTPGTSLSSGLSGFFGGHSEPG